MPNFHIRPQQYRNLPAGRIDPHPDNWRIHTADQTSKLTAILDENGFVGTLLVRPHGEDREGPRYQCLDGHERLSRFGPEEKVPCLIVKMSDEEAAKFVATYDTITGLAATDIAALTRLTAGIEWDHQDLEDLISTTLADAEALTAAAYDELFQEDDDGDDGDEAAQPKARHTEESAPDQTGQLTELWQVLVTCEDEADQRAFLETMADAGRTAKALNT